MAIEDLQLANRYFERCVEHMMRVRPCERAEAEQIERAHLGYYAGYYSDETRARVERLFACAHPVFGAIETFGPMTPDAALRSGMDRGTAARGEA
jgi:hypothetical protein